MMKQIYVGEVSENDSLQGCNSKMEIFY